MGCECFSANKHHQHRKQEVIPEPERLTAKGLKSMKLRFNLLGAKMGSADWQTPESMQDTKSSEKNSKKSHNTNGMAFYGQDQSELGLQIQSDQHAYNNIYKYAGNGGPGKIESDCPFDMAESVVKEQDVSMSFEE